MLYALHNEWLHAQHLHSTRHRSRIKRFAHLHFIRLCDCKTFTSKLRVFFLSCSCNYFCFTFPSLAHMRAQKCSFLPGPMSNPRENDEEKEKCYVFVFYFQAKRQNIYNWTWFSLVWFAMLTAHTHTDYNLLPSKRHKCCSIKYMHWHWHWHCVVN